MKDQTFAKPAKDHYDAAVIIAGTRTFDNHKLLEWYIGAIMQQLMDRGSVIVLSGGAPGADKLGERWAREHNIPCMVFPADWKEHGKRAGYVRNKEMAENATHLIAFHDGKSRGTQMMIDLAREHDLWTSILAYGQ